MKPAVPVTRYRVTGVGPSSVAVGGPRLPPYSFGYVTLILASLTLSSGSDRSPVVGPWSSYVLPP